MVDMVDMVDADVASEEVVGIVFLQYFECGMI